MSWPKQKRQTDNQQYTHKKNNISAIVYNMNKQKTKMKMKKILF